MGTDVGDIVTDHNHAAIPTTTAAAAVTKGIHAAPHLATTAAHTALWLIDAPIASYTRTHPTDIVTPNLKLTTSPTNITNATIPWTIASLTPTTFTTLHRDHSQ